MNQTLLNTATISLLDYDYQQDLSIRLLLSSFTQIDRDVLEEILYSSLKISVKKLARSIDQSEEGVLSSLEKLEKMGLLQVSGETILIDKRKRRYFDIHILPFDEDFFPTLSYVRSLLQLLPIDLLPNWYSISRNSSNIFTSIVEKIFYTPYSYNRHREEIFHTHELLEEIVIRIEKSSRYLISASELCLDFGLTNEELETYILLLEYNFLAYRKYIEINGKWQLHLTLLHEWQKYLSYIHESPMREIEENKLLLPVTNPYSAMQDLCVVLSHLKRDPIVYEGRASEIIPPSFLLSSLHIQNDPSYVTMLIETLFHLRLVDQIDNTLYACEASNNFLGMTNEDQAFYLYQNPMLDGSFFAENDLSFSEKQLREAERNASRLIDQGWIYAKDLLRSMQISFREEHAIYLKQEGKNFSFQLPSYSDEEKKIVYHVMIDWLCLCGITIKGSYEGEYYLKLTPFGYKIFEE